ncbi:hypothetical protein PBAL39_25475 [Pedobacter sp. BAL39]|nr:hypothetical protein PBAL39_25475 [Pedobacter sp. BAL39]
MKNKINFAVLKTSIDQARPANHIRH